MTYFSKSNFSIILNKSFFRFILSTIFNFIISFFPYLILIYIGVSYFIAYLIAFIILLISSTLINIKFSFISSLRVKKIIIYSIYYTLYFYTGYLIIWYSIETIKVNPYLAPLINIILLPLHYFFSKLIIKKI